MLGCPETMSFKVLTARGHRKNRKPPKIYSPVVLITAYVFQYIEMGLRRQ